MHEMALCQGMLDLIEDQRNHDPFNAVRKVVVEIGALGHVDPHALAFAFDVAAADTVAANAELEILEIPGRGWCMDCSESFWSPGPIGHGFEALIRQQQAVSRVSKC